jgi:phosphoribosylformylglycinamidine synthase
MELHLDRVPTRETGMTPYEIMLSESQERMLIVCKKGREDDLEAIFAKWDLNAVPIGTVVEGDRVRLFWHGEKVGDLRAEHLDAGSGAPVYERETERPAYLDATQSFDADTLPRLAPEAAQGALIDVLTSPNIASKRWVYEQYDTMVRTNTVVGPGPSDAAVVRIKGTNRGLAVKTDCNGRYVYLNPQRGAQIAVAEAARNVVCAGGEPLAITNCLNFGNPYKPEVYWTFARAIEGMGDACRALNTPVTGGNVSFYNEHPEGAVYPTPTIGMLGLVHDIEQHATTAGFKSPGDIVFLLTPAAWIHRDDLGGSEYLAHVHDQVTGDAPHLDLDEEVAVQAAMRMLIQKGLVTSAHDVSEGGLAVTLAESALFSKTLGADIDLSAPDDIRLDALLFGEAQSRIVFTTSADDAEAVAGVLADHAVQTTRLGSVAASRLRIAVNGQPVADVETGELRIQYETAIPSRMAS